MKPNRTNLSVPGHIPKMHRKALNSSADVVMFDLEDSVPADQKENARFCIIETLQSGHLNDKTIAVRINAVDTPYAYREVVDLVEQAGSHIEAIVVPKINHPGDIHFMDRLLNGIEKTIRIDHTIMIEASIETAKGLETVSDIATASDRIRSLVFGVADYSESVGVRLVSLSGHGENEEDVYPGHRWHYPLSKMIAAAKANDLLAIDAPFGNFKNPTELKRSAEKACALGCDGKWVIHPDQIDIVNQVFTPSIMDIKRAKQILASIEDAHKAGKGAISVEGKMIDQATVRLAEKMCAQAAYLGILE